LVRKLSKDALKTLEFHVREVGAAKNTLEETLAAFLSKMEGFDEQIREAYAEIESEQAVYNEACTQAKETVDELYTEMETYFDERSDEWQEDDTGTAYSEWMGNFELDFDEVEVDIPEPYNYAEIGAEMENFLDVLQTLVSDHSEPDYA
jgi:predicted nuclease with TOPRIM domain